MNFLFSSVILGFYCTKHLTIPIKWSWVMHKMWGPRFDSKYELTWVTSLINSRYTSVLRVVEKLRLIVVLLHPSWALDPMGRVLLWSHPNRITMLVAPYPFFAHKKKTIKKQKLVYWVSTLDPSLWTILYSIWHMFNNKNKK